MQQLRRRCYWPSAEWSAKPAPNLPHQFPSRSHRFISNGMPPTTTSKSCSRSRGTKKAWPSSPSSRPDRRTVVTFKAPDSSTSGIKVPEAAYPEGVYEFAGRTFSGAKLVGKSTLSHRLAATATIVKPAPAAANVPVRALRLAWGAVDGVASYSIGIKQEELNVNRTALLPASSTSFAVPDGFLARGRKYTLAVGAVTREGNITFVETTFTTEK